MNEMDEFISQLTESIRSRQSRRKYLNQKLTEEHKQKISDFIKKISVPFDHKVLITIHQKPNKRKVFQYPKMNNVDTFAGVISTKDILDQAKTGFVGELFILFCESIGVSTCWIGRYRKAIVNQIIQSKGGWIACITPLGYAENKQGLSEKIFSKKKNSVEENLHENSISELPESIRDALELACLAPSALNNQCWYFDVQKEGKNYVVEISKPVGYQHFKWHFTDIDVGTSAAHFWLGLKKQNIICQTLLEEKQGKAVWRFQIKLD